MFEIELPKLQENGLPLTECIVRRMFVDACKDWLGMYVHTESIYHRLMEKCGLSDVEAMGLVEQAWKEVLDDINENPDIKKARAVAFYSFILRSDDFTVNVKMKAQEELNKLNDIGKGASSGGGFNIGSVNIQNIGDRYRAPDEEERKGIDGFLEAIVEQSGTEKLEQD